MIKILYTALIIFTCLTAMASDGEYAVSKIPAELLKNAHVVIRKQVTSIEMKSLDKMIVRDKYALTVLDEKGDKYVYMVEGYDKFSSIETMDGTLYDANGKKLKTVKKADIKDESTTSDNTLAGDRRMKYHNFYYRAYPYTVEYETEVIDRETMFYPNWNPVMDKNISVEQSSMIVSVPADYAFRYKCYNCIEPVITNSKEHKEYRWELNKFSAVTKEFASPSWKKIVPYIVMAPSAFQIDDYKGDMTDWKELGKFTYSLNKGRDVLPENIKQKVHKLTDGLTTKEEKIKVLYTYLQDNTHYISIQLGIGGWQPFDANFVASKAYGDCKALSNYMVALLKEAGVTSFYTLIKAGDDEEDIITEFPSQQFNHVITCVPIGKDTVWLECTSQTEVPGYMGEFTGNRHALLITEEGGKLVSTPHYGYKENIRQRKVTALVNDEGQLNAQVFTQYNAVARDNIHQVIHGLPNEKIKEYLKDRIDLPNFDIKQFAYKENRSLLPSIDETITVVADNYATVSGKRIFIVPNVFSKTSGRLEVMEERKYDIVLNTESTSIDSVEIIIPAGYRLEALSPDTKLENKFGKYYSAVKVADNKVTYYRRMEQYSGHYPAKDYSDLAKFFDQVYKADRSRIVLVKNEQ